MENLKKGDKLIFKQHGGVLSANKGYVYTFNNWYKSKHFNNYYLYWQSEECINESPNHNFLIHDVELFDINKHKEYVIVTQEILKNDYKKFKNEWRTT
jgi:hypothetical protein